MTPKVASSRRDLATDTVSRLHFSLRNVQFFEDLGSRGKPALVNQLKVFSAVLYLTWCIHCSLKKTCDRIAYTGDCDCESNLVSIPMLKKLIPHTA